MENERQYDPWALPTFVLWLLFLSIGFMPEVVFYLLREMAGVVTQRAMVNSSAIVTVGYALYLGYFVDRDCRARGAHPHVAQGNAVQVGLLAVLAFLPVSMQLVHEAGDIAASNLRWLTYLVYAAGLAKLLAWLYLISLFIRYYVFGSRMVFVDLLALFPSSHETRAQASGPPPPLTVLKRNEEDDPQKAKTGDV